MNGFRHHPKTETLAEFAAGRLDEALAVVIATHAAECAQCARAISDFETIGGALLEDAEPVAMADDALEKILARAGANVSAPQTDAPAPILDKYLKGSLDDVKWRWVAPGVYQHVMKAQGYRSGVLRLVRFAPGKGVPLHTHHDKEFTLIMRGAYNDGISEFRAGDLSDFDGDQTHEPIAIGEEDCICLIATAAPLNFKTALGRIIQPFIGL